jgi:hypothetical protein
VACPFALGEGEHHREGSRFIKDPSRILLHNPPACKAAVECSKLQKQNFLRKTVPESILALDKSHML